MATTPKLLVMRESDLIDDEERADQREFPTRWTQGDQVLGLAYRFEPGADDDGVSVVVPLPLLAQIEDRGFDWQVPGLRAELVTGLLRALPRRSAAMSSPRPIGPRSSVQSWSRRDRSRTAACRRARSRRPSPAASNRSRISWSPPPTSTTSGCRRTCA